MNFKYWQPLPHVHCAMTCRAGGVSEPPYDTNNLALHVDDDAHSVQRNRRQLLQALPHVRDIQWLQQVHGIEVATACSGSVTLTADAVISTTPKLACAILTADCLPILLASSDGTQVAAIHAGWRSLAGDILNQTLARFANKDGLYAYLGAAISVNAFEVGPEVKAAFMTGTNTSSSEACFRRGKGDRWYSDLYQIAREQLERAGVKQIEGGDECTFSQPADYYSYRRDGQTGRFASLIWIG